MMDNMNNNMMKDAEQWLNIAISRHQRHMDGKEPTSGADGEISQKLMMEEMKYALQSLTNGYAITSHWYDRNVSKFPAKIKEAM